MKCKSNVLKIILILTFVYMSIVIISNVLDKPIIIKNQNNNRRPSTTDNIRLCTFILPGKKSGLTGVRINKVNKILPLQTAHKLFYGKNNAMFSDMLGIIKNYDQSKALIKKIITLYKEYPNSIRTYKEEEVAFLPPIPQPIKLVDCSCPFWHFRNSKRAFAKKILPSFIYHLFVVPLNWLSDDSIFSPEKKFLHFGGNNLGIYGSGEDVELPAGITEIDIEAELAVVISKDGKDIPVENAVNHIAGYLLYNDFSQRDIQREELRGVYGFVKSKAINAMGPYIVTNIDPALVKIDIMINSKKIITCDTSDLRWSVLEVISYVSSLGEGIAAGQIIGMGTLSGGSLFELERPMLTNGDTVILKGNFGLGSLRNKISNN